MGLTWEGPHVTESTSTTPEEFTTMIQKSIALWKDVAAKAKVVVE